MRHPILLQAALAALALGSAQLQAGERFPAANFEPQVIYQDTETAPSSNHSESAADTASDRRFPAANFTPRVIFQDLEQIKSTGPLAVNAAPSERPNIASTGSSKNLSGHVKPSGAISDSSPPYGLLMLALGLIGLAFWWSFREEKHGNPEGSQVATAGKATVETETEEDIEDPQEHPEEDDHLHQLAEEVETTMATSNRQRANKTKRARRR